MDKYLDKQGLVSYTHKMKEYIDSKVQNLSDNEIDEALIGYHLKLNTELSAHAETGVNASGGSDDGFDYKIYLDETDLETNEVNLIEIEGAGYLTYDAETGEATPVPSSTSAKYINPSTHSVIETISKINFVVYFNPTDFNFETGYFEGSDEISISAYYTDSRLNRDVSIGCIDLSGLEMEFEAAT